MRMKFNNPMRLQITALKDILYSGENESLSVGILVFSSPHPYLQARVQEEGGENPPSGRRAVKSQP